MFGKLRYSRYSKVLVLRGQNMLQIIIIISQKVFTDAIEMIQTKKLKRLAYLIGGKDSGGDKASY